jgi:hypothetical protein
VDPTQLASQTQPADADFNPAPPNEPPAEKCPKCEKKLIDPQGLGWCRSCGYCKSLEDDKARAPLETHTAPRKPSALGLVEFGQYIAGLPSWVRVLCGGAAAVVMLNIPLTLVLPADGLERAVVATAEISMGVLMVFAAQTWALCLLASGDDKLGFKDAILPGHLWAVTFRELPKTRAQVWMVGWGITCVLSGVLVVGGLTHWLTYLPKSSTPAPEPAVQKKK